MELRWWMTTAPAAVMQRRVWHVCFFVVFALKKKTFCGTSVQMQNEYIKDSSRICPQTRPCQTNKASSNASPGCLQLTDGAIPACVCLPTFQYHHHHLFLLSTAGHLLLLLLCGAACRRIVSLEQLVHLPLHLWRVALAVALGDGEPLAHGGRRQSRSLSSDVVRDTTKRTMEKWNKIKTFSPPELAVWGLSFAVRTEPLPFFFCREIRCVIAAGPSHQPVSARRLQRVWVLEPIFIRPIK